jgi:hypothetical protein
MAPVRTPPQSQVELAKHLNSKKILEQPNSMEFLEPQYKFVEHLNSKKFVEHLRQLLKTGCYSYNFGKNTKILLQQLLKPTCYLSTLTIHRPRARKNTHAERTCYPDLGASATLQDGLRAGAEGRGWPERGGPPPVLLFLAGAGRRCRGSR